MTAPENPAGPYKSETPLAPARRAELIEEIAAAPAGLRRAVAGLTAAQLDTKYRNWTARQIAHHLADSHVNAYARFRLALTEDRPTIKPYQEGAWVQLPDAATGDIAWSLALLDALHVRWVALLRSLTPAQFARVYFHPESGKDVTLDEALGSYAWHARHHTAQIDWLRQQHGW